MFDLEESWAHCNVMGGGVVFGDMICLEVFISWNPVDDNFVLFYAVLNPMELHVNCF